MRTALLVIDLEGVAGVDTLGALVAGSLTYPSACAALTRETAAAVQGLLERGFDRVRVSDSHRAGAMRLNVDPRGLPEGTEVFWEEDAYSAALFEGVSAVACLGMHAPAGTKGFAAHTMDVHCGWSLGGRALSETDIVFALAAEHGVPVLFSSGDDVLEASLRLSRGLRRGGAAFVRTKRAVGNRQSESLPFNEAAEALRRTARACDPVDARGLAGEPFPLTLELSFKSAWQAQLACDGGAERVDARTVRVPLTASTDAFRTVYDEARRLTALSSARLGEAIRGMPGLQGFEEDATSLVARPLHPAPQRDTAARAARALEAFLRRTDGTEDWQLADRAITLHMLEGHAPRFFEQHALAPQLSRAVERLALLPRDFPQGLDPFAGMARLDALYLRHVRGHALSADAVDASALRDYVMFGSFAFGRLWGWLMSELAGRAGLLPRAAHSPRVLRQTRREDDLYWVTHLFLLGTDYLARPLPKDVLLAEREELLLAAEWLVRGRQVDLAAEATFVLQAAGEHASAEHRALLSLLSANQRRDGTVTDQSRSPSPDARQLAHCTAAALVAFAGAGERRETR